jgi:hypothetical protein
MGGLRRGAVSIGLVSLESTIGILPDGVRPYLSVSVGHDGRRGITIGATTVRVVCANTLQVAESELATEESTVRARHTRKQISDLRDDVMRMVDSTVGIYADVARRIDALRQTTISEDDARTLCDGQGKFERLWSDAHNGVGQDPIGLRTVWDVVNAATQFASRKGAASGLVGGGATRASTVYKRALAYAGV